MLTNTGGSFTTQGQVANSEEKKLQDAKKQKQDQICNSITDAGNEVINIGDYIILYRDKKEWKHRCYVYKELNNPDEGKKGDFILDKDAKVYVKDFYLDDCDYPYLKDVHKNIFNKMIVICNNPFDNFNNFDTIRIFYYEDENGNTDNYLFYADRVEYYAAFFNKNFIDELLTTDNVNRLDEQSKYFKFGLTATSDKDGSVLFGKFCSYKKGKMNFLLCDATVKEEKADKDGKL